MGPESPPTGRTWEYILARAIIDGIAGDGGEFWANYGAFMPHPKTLAHPLLLPENLLAELHDEVWAVQARPRGFKAPGFQKFKPDEDKLCFST